MVNVVGASFCTFTNQQAEQQAAERERESDLKVLAAKKQRVDDLLAAGKSLIVFPNPLLNSNACLHCVVFLPPSMIILEFKVTLNGFNLMGILNKH